MIQKPSPEGATPSRLRSDSGKTPDSLPKKGREYARSSKAAQRPDRLPGSVVAQYRTVGDKRHGPYWFRVWWEGGRQRKAYVPARDLDAVRAACERWRERRRLSDKRRDLLDRRDAQADESRARWEIYLGICHPALSQALRKVDRAFGTEGGNSETKLP